MTRIGIIALALVALCFGAAPISRADNNDFGKQAHLSLGTLVTGAQGDIRLRSTERGSLALVLFGAGNGPLVGPSLTLYLDPGFLLVNGVIGTDGLFEFSVNVPSDPILDGFPIHSQGLVISNGRVIPSNPRKLVITPSASTTFSDVSSQLPSSGSAKALGDSDECDLDGDGDFDLVFSSSNGPVFYINDGAGNFVDESASRIFHPHASECVELGDVDGDGDPDLFVGGGLSDVADPPLENSLYINDGSGRFTKDTLFPAGAGVTSDAEFGDVDLDGDLDLILANGQDSAHGGEQPDADSLLINQGMGTFVEDASFASSPFNDPNAVSTDVSLGDIDNDGDLDILIITNDIPNFGRENVLIRNDGSLLFVDVSSAQLLDNIQDNGYEAEFIDANNDGYLDIIMAQSLLSTGGATLHLNTGVGNPGVFREDTSFPFPMNNWEKIRLGLDVADIDSDGDIDVLMSVHFLPDSQGVPRGYSQLFVNQGGAQMGTLGQYSLDLAFGNPNEVFVAPDATFLDFDLDGDMDLFIPSNGFFGAPPYEDDLWRNEI